MACNPCVSLVFSLPGDVESVINVLKVLQELGIRMRHIESRPSRHNLDAEQDYFVDCEGPQGKLDDLTERLKSVTNSLTVHVKDSVNSSSTKGSKDEIPWFPRSVWELDRCCTNVYRYGDELTPDHPGFGDEGYKLRRKFIAKSAYSYKYGDSIPRIEYTEDEIKIWRGIFSRQTKLYPTHACKEYNKLSPALFEACGYREDNVPQLEDVSRYLRAKTGWQLWPVVGWMPPRDFLAALAFRIFPTTQYIRHFSSPFYTPEPDVCHELMGHAPLFCDPSFAQFSQEIGLASLGVPDEWIEKLATLYWFTIEFGLCKEDGKPKAYGAGILSANKELQHCVTDEPVLRDFNISQALVQQYPEHELQPVYFVVESLDDMKNKMIEYAKTIPRSFALRYNPYLQSVEVLDSYDAMEKCTRDIQYEMGVLQDGLKKKCFV